MGGFRIGFAIGNHQLITALRQIKFMVDFNEYKGILDDAITALTSSQECVEETIKTYQERRDFLIGELNKIGWNVPTPSATLYVWAKLPKQSKKNSIDFCVELVKKIGVALSPCAGFGNNGEGYVRFVLVKSPAILQEAIEKIAVFIN